MKSKFQYLLLLLLLTPYILNAQAKQSAIQQFLNIPPGLKHASVGICVKDMTGKQINGHNADKSYTPASILKVITTATALETLGGADYRYKTTLSKDKDKENHLLIHGYGDPTLGGTQHLENFPLYFFI